MNLKLYSLEALDAYVLAQSQGEQDAATLRLPTGDLIVPPLSDLSRLADRIRRQLKPFKWFPHPPTPLTTPAHSQTPSTPQSPMSPPSINVSASLSSSSSRRGGPEAIAMPPSSPMTQDEAKRPRRTWAGLSRQRLFLVLAIGGTLLVVIYLALTLEAQEAEVVHVTSSRLSV